MDTVRQFAHATSAGMDPAGFKAFRSDGIDAPNAANAVEFFRALDQRFIRRRADHRFQRVTSRMIEFFVRQHGGQSRNRLFRSDASEFFAREHLDKDIVRRFARLGNRFNKDRVVRRFANRGFQFSRNLRLNGNQRQQTQDRRY